MFIPVKIGATGGGTERGQTLVIMGFILTQRIRQVSCAFSSEYCLMEQCGVVISLSLNLPYSSRRSDLDVTKMTGTWKQGEEGACL